MQAYKHAYLIMAHNNWSILEKLLQMIDYPLNDIYIHIDAKVRSFDEEHFKNLLSHSNVTFIQNRINTKWGDSSLILTELLLFKTASSKSEYSRYHMISGVDLPLMSQRKIHSICESNSDKEFISFCNLDDADVQKMVNTRINKIHLFTYWKRMADDTRINHIKRKICKFISKNCLMLQRKVIPIHLKEQVRNVQWGSAWTSLTHNTVLLIIDKMKSDFRLYKYSNCGDEHYKHTIIRNSDQKINISEHSYMRTIDWDRGRPYTFMLEDFDSLINSGSFFARKFSEENMKIVNKIFDHVMRQN